MISPYPVPDWLAVGRTTHKSLRIAEVTGLSILARITVLGCAKAFSSLKYSASEQDHRLVEVYDHLKPALEKRNDSWLAHGTRAANEADFQQMWEAVLKELGVAADTLPSWPQISFIE